MVLRRLAMLFLFSLFVSTSYLHADTESWNEELNEIENMNIRESFTPQEEKAILGKKGEKLIDVEKSTLAARVDGLTRRVGFLEKENRLQQEQIRRLDRSVSDLKRRR